jgi:hypothetical protein
VRVRSMCGSADEDIAILQCFDAAVSQRSA